MGVPLALLAFTASTALKAYGEHKSYKDQSSASSFNAGLSELQARLIEQSSFLDQYRMGRQKKQFTSMQRAQYARSGVTSEGSPLEVMADSASQLELDKQIAKYNADIQKNQYLSQANQQREQAKALKRQSIISPFTTLLGFGSAFVGGK